MRIKNRFSSWRPIVIGCLAVWLFCLNQARVEFFAQSRALLTLLTVIGFLACFAYQVIFRKERDADTIAGYILLFAFVLRAYFVIAAPYSITKHDTGAFIDLDTGDFAWGHFGYIEYLYHYLHLPDFDPRTCWSFYNPPGFYALGALALRITHGLLGVAAPACYKSLQVLTLFFSSMTVWVFFRIFTELEFPKKYVLPATAFVAFFPFFTIFAASLTNDIQAIFFMMLAIWYTLRWYKRQTTANILVVAAALGLGMFTKLNSALLSFGIGFVFLAVLWKNFSQKKKYLAQFALFFAVCAPLGLYYPIRNFLLYRIPFNYVQKVWTGSELHINGLNLIDGLGLDWIRQLSYAFATLDSKTELNLWIQTIRTALFDELSPPTANNLLGAWALILLWGNVILATVLNAAFIAMAIKRNRIRWEIKGGFILIYSALLISYIMFYFDMPYTCTTNFRYIAPSLLFPLLGGLCAADNADLSAGAEKGALPVLTRFTLLLTGAMIVASIAFTAELIAVV